MSALGFLKAQCEYFNLEKLKSIDIVICDFWCRSNIKSRKSGELNAQH